MKKILLTCMMMLIGLSASAQISYSQDWTTTGLNGWSGSVFSRTAVANQICGTTGGTIRGERYFGNSGQFTSPALTGNNQGPVTFTFDYKVTNYSAGTVATPATGIGQITVEYATSASGPWSTALVINSTNHVAANTCATKTAIINPSAGNLFVRFNVVSDATTDSYYYFDNVVVSQGAAPTCFAPSAVNISNLTTASATLNWTAPTSTPANGYDIYYSTSSTAPTASTTPTTTSATTSVALGSLTANTTYYAWVRSNCSAADQSSWVSTSFYTGYCVPTVSGTSYWITSFTSSGAATNISYTGTSTGPAGYRDVTATKKISNYAGSVTPITLSLNGTSTGGFAVWIDWNNDLVFQASEKVYGTTSFTNTTSGATITVPIGTALGNYRMRVAMDYNISTVINPCAAISSGDYLDATFEVVVPPTCSAPTALVSSNITLNSADLSWTAPATAPGVGYDVYYSTTNAAPTAATVLNATNSVASTTTTASLSGLANSTLYYVWVRSNCSAADQSSWTALPSLTTVTPPPANDNCSGAVPLTVNPDYNCGVVTAGSNVGATDSGVEPALTVSGTPDNDVWFSFVATQTGHRISLTNIVAVVGTSTDLDIAVFSGTCGSLAVVGSSDPTTYNVTGLTIGETYLVSVYGYFANPSASNAYTTFNICIGSPPPPPTCIAPTAPTITGATASSLNVSWTAASPAPAIGYQLYYSSTNTAPTGATVLDGSNSLTSATTSATISGLTADTVYYVWVRSNCAAADQSTWTGPVSANTGYCVPSATSTSIYYITSFTSTGADTDINYTAAAKSATGYTNATTNKISNVEGSVTSITIAMGPSSTGGFAVFIDWNNNLTFEPSERVYVTTAYTATTSGATITVPAGTALGNYRMRVVMNFLSNAPSNPCGTTGSNDYVDTTFEVTSSLATGESIVKENGVNIYPNPFTDFIRISDVKDVVSVSIVDMSGRLVKTVKPANEINLSSLKSGMYLINLKMKDGSVKTVKSIKK